MISKRKLLAWVVTLLRLYPAVFVSNSLQHLELVSPVLSHSFTFTFSLFLFSLPPFLLSVVPFLFNILCYLCIFLLFLLNSGDLKSKKVSLSILSHPSLPVPFISPSFSPLHIPPSILFLPPSLLSLPSPPISLPLPPLSPPSPSPLSPPSLPLSPSPLPLSPPLPPSLPLSSLPPLPALSPRLSPAPPFSLSPLSPSPPPPLLSLSSPLSLSEALSSAGLYECLYLELSASLEHGTEELLLAAVRRARGGPQGPGGAASWLEDQRRESLTSKAKRFLSSLVPRYPRERERFCRQKSRSCHDLGAL